MYSCESGQGPIRVLIANDHLGFGDEALHGVGRLLIEWATGFDPDHVQTTVCCVREASSLGRTLLQEGVPLTFFGRGRYNPLVLGDFMRFIRAQRIDVLHLNGFGASTFGRIAGLLTGTPTVVHVHDTRDAEDTHYPVYVQLMDRLLAPVTAAAIAVSRPVKSFCIEEMGFEPDQVHIVHNPTPRLGFVEPSHATVAALRTRYELEHDAVVFGTASRLAREKGIHVLIEAVARIRSASSAVRLLIVGDGPARDELEMQVRALGLEDQVTFAGFQRDVAAHLRLFSALVIPSIWQEPFPLSALEAFGAAVPVVASRVGGLPEAVSDGYNGILVPPGDVESLSKGLHRLLKDRDLTARMSANALETSQHFSLPKHTSQLEQIYRNACAGRGISRRT